MKITVLDYLDNSLENNRVVYETATETITAKQLATEAFKTGTLLASFVPAGNAIVVFAEKNLHIPSLYLGVISAGCYYIPLNPETPKARLDYIFDIAKPRAVLAVNPEDIPDNLNYNGKIFTLQDVINTKENYPELAKRRENIISTDPMYVIFTSGTSGIPKGVITPHKAVIYCIDVFADLFDINKNDILGNQAPFDYIAALRDIYLPLAVGAKTVLIDKKLFSMPAELFKFLREKEVNTLCWASPAFALCCTLGAFDEPVPKSLRKLFFAGSVLQPKHLKVWKDNLPDATFTNHYGPTEITSSCTYYTVPNDFDDTKPVPIGKVFPNSDVLILDENNKPVKPREQGEICVRGSGLALGYYKNPEKTAESFVLNSLQELYPEIIYKTGDVGSIDENGIMHFHGRRDFQIKHMGHRIELSEIEFVAQKCEELEYCVCLYNYEKEQINLFYTGTIEKRQLAIYLRESLASFMVPRKLTKLEEFPKLQNGKIDLGKLKEMM